MLKLNARKLNRIYNQGMESYFLKVTVICFSVEIVTSYHCYRYRFLKVTRYCYLNSFLSLFRYFFKIDDLCPIEPCLIVCKGTDKSKIHSLPTKCNYITVTITKKK